MRSNSSDVRFISKRSYPFTLYQLLGSSRNNNDAFAMPKMSGVNINTDFRLYKKRPMPSLVYWQSRSTVFQSYVPFVKHFLPLNCIELSKIWYFTKTSKYKMTFVIPFKLEENGTQFYAFGKKQLSFISFIWRS